MRSPNTVLDSLEKQSIRKDYKFERIYRNLYNVEFYLMAYARINAKEGNMTQGVDGQTIDGMSLERIERLIESMKDCSYQPKPSKRVYIPKKKTGKRPLGIPSFEDKLVQEVVRLLVEAMYEKHFLHILMGFDQKKLSYSTHASKRQIYRSKMVYRRRY